jgi:hypothetical protein
VQHHVVVPPAEVLQPGQAGPAAVGPVHHVVRLAPRRRLAAPAGVLAALVPQVHQPPQMHRDVIGLPDIQRPGPAAGPTRAAAACGGWNCIVICGSTGTRRSYVGVYVRLLHRRPIG